MAAQPTPQAAHATPAKKSKLPLILGVVVVVLAGGGGAYYWSKRSAPKATEAPKAEVAEPGGVVGFDPFVVNLADGAGSRFLRVSVQLVIPGKAAAEEVSKDDVLKVRLRSDVLDLLSQQTSDRLVTPEGKTELKAAIAKRASVVIQPRTVSDVLFTDFLVQF